MEKEKVILTYQALIFGGQWWQKLVHTPCQVDQHSYWIHKLNKQVERAQKVVGPIFKKFVEELGEKYGTKDKDGKPVNSGNGLPQAEPATRDAYDDMLDEFMQKTHELDFNKLPLEYFAHIGKSPMDWVPLEQIAVVSGELLDQQASAKNSAHEQLRAITGGQG